MSNENQETIADIVTEMRGPYYKMGRSNASLDKDMMGYMSFIANRIEAAHKRETGDLRCLLKVVEDALGESRIAICRICDMKHTCGHGTAKFDPCCIIKDIDSAIAAIRGVGGAE